MQAFASSLSNSLAAHALLQGIGVGDENATVLAATMTWIMKGMQDVTCRNFFLLCLCLSFTYWFAVV